MFELDVNIFFSLCCALAVLSFASFQIVRSSAEARLRALSMTRNPLIRQDFEVLVGRSLITARAVQGSLFGASIRVSGPALPHSCPTLHTHDPLNDIPTGDDAFDRTVHIDAVAPHVALSYLSVAARTASQRALRFGATLDGHWSVVVPPRQLGDLRQVVDAIAAASHAFQVDPTGSARHLLTQRASTDPVPGMRAHAIRHLASHGGVPVDIAKILADNPAPEVRFAVGKLGRALGRRALCSLLTDGTRRWRIKAAIALALEKRDVHEALIETVLIDALDHDVHGESAAEGLIPIASPRVLPALAARPGNNPALRRVRTALRARYQADAGSVSLVQELHVGAVSLI